MVSFEIDRWCIEPDVGYECVIHALFTTSDEVELFQGGIIPLHAAKRAARFWKLPFLVKGSFLLIVSIRARHEFGARQTAAREMLITYRVRALQKP